MSFHVMHLELFQSFLSSLLFCMRQIGPVMPTHTVVKETKELQSPGLSLSEKTNVLSVQKPCNHKVSQCRMKSQMSSPMSKMCEVLHSPRQYG